MRLLPYILIFVTLNAFSQTKIKLHELGEYQGKNVAIEGVIKSRKVINSNFVILKIIDQSDKGGVMVYLKFHPGAELLSSGDNIYSHFIGKVTSIGNVPILLVTNFHNVKTYKSENEPLKSKRVANY